MRKYNGFIKILKFFILFVMMFCIFPISSCWSNSKIDFSLCSINYSIKNIYSYRTKINESGFIDEPVKVDRINNALLNFEIIMADHESKPSWLTISKQNMVHWENPPIQSILRFYVRATFRFDKTISFTTNEFALYINDKTKIFVNIPTNSFKIMSQTEGKSDFFSVTSNDDTLILENVSWSIIGLSVKITWLSISSHFGSNNVYVKWTSDSQPGIYTFKILASMGSLSAESEKITINVIGDYPTPPESNNIQLYYDGFYSFSITSDSSGTIEHKITPYFSDKTINIPNDLQYELINFNGSGGLIQKFSFDIDLQDFSCVLKWNNIQKSGNYNFNIRCFSKSMNVSNVSQKFYFNVSDSPIKPINHILYSYDGDYIYNTTIGIEGSNKNTPFKVCFDDQQISPEFISAEILMDNKPKWLNLYSDSSDQKNNYRSWYFGWDLDSTPGLYSFSIKFFCNQKKFSGDPIITKEIFLNIEKPKYIPFNKFYIVNDTLFGFVNEFNPSDYLYCNTLLIPKAVKWINLQTDSKEFKPLTNSIPLSIQYLIFENDSQIRGIIDEYGPSHEQSSLSYVDFLAVCFPSTCQGSDLVSFPPYFFKNWKHLESVKLPKNFSSSIGMFENCVELKTIFNDYKNFGYDVPEDDKTTRKEIGNKYCLNFGSGILSQDMFKNCTNLKEIFISDTAEISQNAFYGCSKLNRLNSNVDGVFNFAKITPPNNHDFSLSGFAHLKTLKNIYFSGNYHTTISDEAFYKCIQLENIYSSNEIEEITSGFKDTLIKKIGRSSFAFCSKLSGSLEFPKTIKKIGDYSFESTNYESILLPSKMQLIVQEKKVISSSSNYTIGEEFIKNDYSFKKIILDSWELYNTYCKPGAPTDSHSVDFYLSNLNMLEKCFLDLSSSEYPYSKDDKHEGWFGDIDKYVSRDGEIVLVNPINPNKDIENDSDDIAQFADTAHGLAQLATKKGGIKGYHVTEAGIHFYDPSNLFYWKVNIQKQKKDIIIA